MHLPPPVHGVSVMNKMIRDSARITESFTCDFINLSTAGTVKSLQKQSARKYFLTAGIILTALFMIGTRRYDKIYITPFPYGPAFIKDSVIILMGRLLGAKPLLHLHTYGFKKASERSGLLGKYYRYVFKNTEVICLSELLVEDIGHLHTGKVHILPNGIPQVNFENRNQITDAPVRLLYLSNLIKGKGILILIEAVEMVKKHGHAFHLRIAGPEHDVDYKTLAALIEKKRLGTDVTLVGPRYGNEKYTEFMEADVFILPSDYDTFGLVLLEAMQFGVPCISTTVGGIPDVLGEGRGLLITEITPEALARAIEHLIQHPEERKRMSVSGFGHYQEKFTWETFETGLINILGQVPDGQTMRGQIS